LEAIDVMPNFGVAEECVPEIERLASVAKERCRAACCSTLSLQLLNQIVIIMGANN